MPSVVVLLGSVPTGRVKIAVLAFSPVKGECFLVGGDVVRGKYQEPCSQASAWN